jgi:cytochrome c
MITGPKARQTPLLAALSLAAAAVLIPADALGADAEAAQGLARQSKCFSCHAVDKEKMGPAWKDVAAKNKGNKDAEAKLVKHLTAGGSDGKHPVVKAKSPDDVKNLAAWILSL